METILFSDLHGNLGALRQLLEEGKFSVCLGDVLGQGDNEACLDLLLERGVPCVKGNHEVDMWDYYQPKLREDLYARIRAWPNTLTDGDALLCHAWLRPIGAGFTFARLLSSENAESMLTGSAFRVAFVGHSHEPGWWESDVGKPRWHPASIGQRLDWSPTTRYIVDVGSLGEPRSPNAPRWVEWDDSGVTWRGLNSLKAT